VENDLIAWLNLAVLIASTVLFLVFYVRSVSPARLEKRLGERAYARCAIDRMVSAALMTLATVNYIVYFFYPLPIGIARTFPWSWWGSALIAAAIAVPSGYLWWQGMRDAGEETLVPKKEHTLYGGIYGRMRHPQAVGEMPFFWVFAFSLHSPLLVLLSFGWVPIFLIASFAEERDLILRYGTEYEAYRQRTGFLFPRCRRKEES